MTKTFKLALEPRWEAVDDARRKSIGFLHASRLSVDTAQSLSMVVCELLENGLKYGSFPADSDRLKLEITITETEATVEVLNPFGEAAGGHLRRLDRTVQWIRGFQDPFEAYIEKLKEVAKKPLDDQESGLGLVRIAYEGRAILDFYVPEAGLLNVSAVAHFGQE